MANVIGLDIGGSKITGIVYNGSKVVKELTIVTPKNLLEFEKNLLKLVDFLSAKQKINGIGAGMAGLVNSEKGIVIHSPNIKFIKNLNLAGVLKLSGIKKVKIDNDANCFTIAEMLVGQAKNLSNFICLTFGTGIGGGIVINKTIYRGQDNLGGELGHLVLSSNFFEKDYQIVRDQRNFLSAGKLIGQALGSLTNIFAPEAIVIGGGFGINEAGKYLPSLKPEMKKYLLDKNSKTRVLISKLKNAGALGAALLVK